MHFCKTFFGCCVEWKTWSLASNCLKCILRNLRNPPKNPPKIAQQKNGRLGFILRCFWKKFVTICDGVVQSFKSAKLSTFLQILFYSIFFIKNFWKAICLRKVYFWTIWTIRPYLDDFWRILTDLDDLVSFYDWTFFSCWFCVFMVMLFHNLFFFFKKYNKVWP